MVLVILYRLYLTIRRLFEQCNQRVSHPGPIHYNKSVPAQRSRGIRVISLLTSPCPRGLEDLPYLFRFKRERRKRNDQKDVMHWWRFPLLPMRPVVMRASREILALGMVPCVN